MGLLLLTARWAMIAFLALAAAPAMSAEADRYAAERRRMLEAIAETARDASRESGRATLDERVMAVLARVPRHRFVSAWDERAAYDNRPLSIGKGQTISQPFIVALMTDVLDVRPESRVLEIGTGSGYQAAVLAELAHTVYTIEIVESLANEARRRLTELGYRNIEYRTGDGYQGWPERAPFDRILVTAAARDVPQPLVDQLSAGGRMVIPLGEPGGVQTLSLLEKKTDGRIEQRPILTVRFVPLTRDGRQ